MAKYIIAASDKGELVIDGPQGYVPTGGAPGGKTFDDIMEYVRNLEGPPMFTYVDAETFDELHERAVKALGPLKETDARTWSGGKRVVYVTA